MLQPWKIDGRPHWETTWPQELWPVFEEFEKFLVIVWDHYGYPKPTEAQLEIAHRLHFGADSYEWSQLSPEDRDKLLKEPREDIIRCFRSLAKSTISAAFAAWRLMRNPRDEKILVTSATGAKAKKFVSQVKNLMASHEMCMWLLEGPRDKGAHRRDMADMFDVAHSSLEQSYSVQARGILTQFTGDRATLIINDDVEIPENCRTEEGRGILYEKCGEFSSIGKTQWGDADILYLGTPQTEESVYNKNVKDRGFRTFCIPARWPQVDKLKNYTLDRGNSPYDILAPYLWAKYRAGSLKPLEITDTRFTDEEMRREEARGRSRFALQYMLDTRLSDADRYPLRQNDLIVFATNPLKAPLTLQWGKDSDKRNVIQDISNLGFTGDYMMRPLFIDHSEWQPYDGKVIVVDPAGRGKDETAWCVAGSLNGIIYVMHVDGVKGDPAEAMMKIAHDAKRYNVNVLEVEPNYAQGTWVAAFGPVLQKVWPGGCTVQEGEWAKGQKETRIIDTLEPAMYQHRVVFDEGLVRQDVKTEDVQYSLMYQLTHITRDRRALAHEDRLETVAGAVAYFQRTLGQDIEESARAVHDSRMEQEMEDFIECFNQGFSQDRAYGGLRKSRGRLRDGERDEVYRVNW